MNPDISSSSTLEKWRVLPEIFGWHNDDQGPPDPRLVMAFGTAASPRATPLNGCVVIGANAFIHNPRSGESAAGSEYWHDSRADRRIDPTLPADFFSPRSNIVDDALRAQVEARLLAPPIHPAEERVLLSAYNYTEIGTVNIFNYDDYAWADDESVASFDAAGTKTPIGSIETTHGLIRLQSDAPFLFTSGITDTVGSFNAEVAPRAYSQNFAAAHNAGIVAAWLLPRIVDYLP